MKCVCGYEGGDFVILEEMTAYNYKTVRETCRGSPFNSLNTSDDRKQVYACPKCGALKIEVN